MSDPTEISGLDLAEAFYREAVAPLLDVHFPTLRYTAGLLGPGSEILGYDDAMSRDHHWGPRALLFLSSRDFEACRDAVHSLLRGWLPLQFRGYPTSFTSPDPNDHGTQLLDPTASGPVNHRVEIGTLSGFLENQIGMTAEEGLQPADWLVIPQQRLLALTSGRLFRDDLDLKSVRERFCWYPHDVWLYLLASCWTRIAQEEHLMGRAGYVGDELGSALIGSRLARDIMRLAFLMERRYAPYPKWFGTAFAQLKSAPLLTPHLIQAVTAANWQDREAALCAAYEMAAVMHNELRITESLETSPSYFFGRPFRVIHAGAFAAALTPQIADPALRSLAARRSIGGIDLLSDSTDLLEAAQPTTR